jgi:sterol desaturase/sphingolipid hydroxylase (fatty acid hydroxylase superfamily)
VFAGFGTGYVVYDSIHFAIHHWSMRNPLARELKRHHLRHHFTDEHTGYGVSSPLWDYVFRTSHRREEANDPR